MGDYDAYADEAWTEDDPMNALDRSEYEHPTRTGCRSVSSWAGRDIGCGRPSDHDGEHQVVVVDDRGAGDRVTHYLAWTDDDRTPRNFQEPTFS